MSEISVGVIAFLGSEGKQHRSEAFYMNHLGHIANKSRMRRFVIWTALRHICIDTVAQSKITFWAFLMHRWKSKIDVHPHALKILGYKLRINKHIENVTLVFGKGRVQTSNQSKNSGVK